MRLNQAVKSIHTHEGARAKHLTIEQALTRTVLSCLLWERGAYEDGEEAAQRIDDLIEMFVAREGIRAASKIASIAILAREGMHLRHAPLWIAICMLHYDETRGEVSSLLERIIQRPDELTEALAMYWKNGRRPLAAQLRKGLARAFCKFDEYQLAKYNRDTAIKLRDVLFLCHAKPKDPEQAEMWRRLIDGNLKTPDTWEVALSATSDKQAEWTRLLSENRLGGLALLRNLRNIQDAGVEPDLIREKILENKFSRVLPFRFIAAARHAVRYQSELEVGMLRALSEVPKLQGTTIFLIDVSGSMHCYLSGKSELRLIEAASALAIMLREICERTIIFTFNTDTSEVPSRRGFALYDAITSRCNGGTYLGRAVRRAKAIPHDRLIVITDEQSADKVPDPEVSKSYMINVASNRNGVGYGAWKHVDGWSESIVKYITLMEDLGLERKKRHSLH